MRATSFIQVLTCFFISIIGNHSVLGNDTILYRSIVQQLDHFGDLEAYDSVYYIYDHWIKTDSFNFMSCVEKGRIAHKVGVCYYLDNQEYQAVEKFKKALEFWTNCSEIDQSEVANTRFNIGVSYQYTPDIHLGKTYVNKAIQYLESDESTDMLDLAYKYQGAGAFYAELNDLVQSETYYQNALNLFLQLPEEKYELIYMYNLLMVLHLEFKNYDAAKNDVQKALDLSDQYPELSTSDDLAYIHLNGAIAYLETDMLDQARHHANVGLGFLDETEQPDLYSNGIELLGAICKQEGNYVDSRKYFDVVLQLRFESRRDNFNHLSRAIALENISEWHLAQREWKESLDFINDALRELCFSHKLDSEKNPLLNDQPIIDPLDVVRLLGIKSKIYTELFSNVSDTAYLLNKLSVHNKIDTIIHLNIANYYFESSKIEWYELAEMHYDEAVLTSIKLYDLLNDIQYLDQAQFFSARSKSLILQQHLKETSAWEEILSKEQLRRIKELVQQVASVRSAMNNASEDLDSLLQTYSSAQIELSIFHENLEQENSTFAAQKYLYAYTPSVEELQQKLNKRSIIIDYYLSADELISFWITSTQFYYQKTAFTDTVSNSIQELIDACHDPSNNFSTTQSHQVYQYLLEPGLQKATASISNLIIIPDDLLYGLSFDILVLDQQSNRFLVEEYLASFNYSTSLINFNDSKNEDRSFVGFGTNYSDALLDNVRDKTYLQDLNQLSNFVYAEQEVKEGAKLFDGRVFVNQEASLDNFFTFATEADIIYLSMHGIVDYDDPSKSCILFDDRNEELLLTPLNLQYQNLNTQLVILSSCNSASGKIYNGEGVNGMTRAFLFSGVKAVVSSLWSATEKTSMDLFQNLLLNFKAETSASKALQLAKKKYLSNASPRFQHPYYWANYVLVGNSNAPSANKLQPVYLLVIGLLAAILIFLLARRRKTNQKR